MMLVVLVYDLVRGCVEEPLEDKSSGGGLTAFLRFR